MSEQIKIETTVKSPVNKVWEYYTNPAHITRWNFATDDWTCPSSENDLRTGGKFTSRMEAKDGSMGFDFGGTYTNVVDKKLIEYTMDDNRTVSVAFQENNDKTLVTVVFDAEEQNSIEMQKNGWQAILNNFKTYTE